MSSEKQAVKLPRFLGPIWAVAWCVLIYLQDPSAVSGVGVGVLLAWGGCICALMVMGGLRAWLTSTRGLNTAAQVAGGVGVLACLLGASVGCALILVYPVWVYVQVMA